MNTNNILNKIANASKIAILSHVNPDGDAIGTALGLYHFLKKEYTEKIIQVIIPNSIPDFLLWLPSIDNVLLHNKDGKAIKSFLQCADLYIYVDLNSEKRIGTVLEVINHETDSILFDHHPKMEAFTSFSIVNTQVSSASEIVYNFICDNFSPKSVPQTSATCFYTGIITDTGNLKHGNLTPKTFELIGELIKAGVNYQEVQSNVFEVFSADRMRLMGYCLNNKMTILKNNKTAYISITQDELKRYNYKIGDTEGFVNLPLNISGIVVSALFTEKEDHIKLSIRSKGNVAINKIVETNFNGGGHKNAAGGKCYKSMEKTIQLFEKSINEIL